jgi:hypothetical protein
VEPIRRGQELPDMPLFLAEDEYVNIPLDATYGDAYATLPSRWRNVLDQ